LLCCWTHGICQPNYLRAHKCIWQHNIEDCYNEKHSPMYNVYMSCRKSMPQLESIRNQSPDLVRHLLGALDPCCECFIRHLHQIVMALHNSHTYDNALMGVHIRQCCYTNIIQYL
jgi:hypothetical protein